MNIKSMKMHDCYLGTIPLGIAIWVQFADK